MIFLGGVLRRRVRRKVAVTLYSGTTITGVLAEADRRALVIKQATVLTRSDSSAADGELVVMLDEVDFLQVL